MHLESPDPKPTPNDPRKLPTSSEELLAMREELGVLHMSPVLRFSALDLACEKATSSVDRAAVTRAFTAALRDVGDVVKRSTDVRGRLECSWTPELQSLMRACDCIIANAPYFSTAQTSLILESMAMIGFRHEKVFQALGVEVIMQKRFLTGAEASRILWACAHLDIREPALVRSLTKAVRAIDRTEPLSPLNRARMSLSLALLSPASVDAVLSSSHLEEENFLCPSRCPTLTWGQAYHALLATGRISKRDEFSRRHELFSQVPPMDPLNPFEISVASALQKFLRYVPHALEVQQNVAGVFTDFVLYLEDRTVAIECDGYQYHYSAGPDGGRVFGRDLIQRSVLEAYGLDVVMISSREWRAKSAQQILTDKLSRFLPQPGENR